MSNDTIKLCPECGQALPPGAPLELCPACLLRAGLSAPSIAAEAGVAAASAGVVAFGDYELIEEIARGGMGVVFRARQRSLNRVVAVKMILAGRLAGEAEVRRFQTEAEAAAKLQHPNIVAIHEVGAHDGQHFFSMDFIEGQSLAEKVFHGPLPPELAARYVHQIAGAIHFAHQRGVLHRDLKPQNVLIDHAGAPRVTDFGLAKLSEAGSAMTHSGAVMGSPSYMSPEQAAGRSRDIGPGTDIYSLGAILYELITGRPPFRAATPLDTMRMVMETEAAAPRWVNPAVPVDLETICLKCLEKDPRRRYATTEELAGDLRRFLDHEPVHARPATRLYRAQKWVRRNPRVSAMGALVVAVAALGFAAVWWQLQKTRAALHLANENALAEATARAPVLSARGFVLHSNGVVSAEFSRDGRRILSASHDGTARLWDAGTGKEMRAFAGHDGSLGPAQFSEDGRHILTFGGDTQHRYARLTPDGKSTTVSTSLRYSDQTVRLWNAETGRQLLLLTNTSSQFADAALSPDGRRIVTASLDGTARLWDAATGRLLHTFAGHAASVRSVRFSPDGARVVTTSYGTKYRYKFQKSAGSLSSSGGSMSVHEKFIARIWDAETGAQTAALRTQPGPGLVGRLETADSLTLAAFSPDGTTIVTAPAAVKNLCVWDARSGAVRARLFGHTHEVNSAVFSRDGARVLTASSDQTARLWDARTGSELAVFKAHHGPVLDASFSPDGKRIATASGDGTARIWDTAGRGLAVLRGHESRVFTVRFSPDGANVVTAGEDGTVRFWPAATLEQLSIPLEGHAGIVTSLRFSADGRRVVTASDDKTARVWNAADGKLLREMKGHGALANKRLRDEALGAVKQADVSADGKFVATASDDPQVILISAFSRGVDLRKWPPPGELLPFHPVRVFETETGREVAGFDIDGSATDVAAFNHAGTVLLAGANGRQRRAAVTSMGGVRSGSSGSKGGPVAAALWNLRTGERMATLEGHEHRVNFAVFSPDDRKVLTGDARKMRLWDAATGANLVEFERPAQAVHGEFSPDSARVLSGEWGTAALWDAKTGKQVLRFKPQQGQVSFATFSPDGKLVLLCGRYGTAEIADAATGESVVMAFAVGSRIGPRISHSDRDGLVQGCFSPDGRLVATLNARGVARVWDVASRRPAAILLTTMSGHKAEIVHITFSPDGRWLGTASKDYTARLWPVSAMHANAPRTE
jgi:WD40 repeat protein/predicted Ser/Thr protein kinase